MEDLYDTAVADLWSARTEPDRLSRWVAEVGAKVRLVIEERGLPLGELAAHGAGWHAHVDDLGAHLEGRGAGSWVDRWRELSPDYVRLAAGVPILEQ